MAWVIVFCGAGIGGAMRHAVNVTAFKLLGLGFPYGTLAVNVLGGFVMGLLVELFVLKGDPGQHWRLFLTTGILGGFTTFSAFSLETALMIQRGNYGTAAFYAAISVTGSVSALFAGLWIGRTL